jgi:Zn-dependent M28 family amino/carboxypeptidase
MALFRKTRRFSPEFLQQLEARLRGHVDVLAGLIGPRHLDKPSSIEAAATYIERQFTEIGDPAVRQTYDAGPATPAANLIVERTGSDRPDQIVVVGAHYDTVPSTPGADDNASAVAMLIEVARLLSRVPAKRTVRFVSFSCEEPPYFCTGSMGSQHYARTCRVRQDNIIAMLCLEMVGYYSTEPGSQKLPMEIPAILRRAFPSRANFLAAVGNLRSLPLVLQFRRGFKRNSRLPLYSIALPERVNAIRLSDNSSFWDQHYPALMITDTSFCRNPHYHQSTDSPDTLDYPRLAQATVGVASAVARLSKAGSAWQSRAGAKQ